MVQALNATWAVLPPPAMALRRIGVALGVKAPDVRPRRSTSSADAIREAQTAGLPVMQGRPDDPMLAFLDLPEPPRTH